MPYKARRPLRVGAEVTPERYARRGRVRRGVVYSSTAGAASLTVSPSPQSRVASVGVVHTDAGFKSPGANGWTAADGYKCRPVPGGRPASPGYRRTVPGTN